jgi:drug/metabolite transporter (DMT)-like permease
VPASALALALAAAVLHAGWNVLLARAHDVRAATTVALAVGVVLFAPAAFVTWDVESDAIPWIATSAALEIVYFALLTGAYRRSDLSLVYPIARGVAPVLVLIGAALAGAALGGLQALGVLLVGGGVLLVRGVRGPFDGRCVCLALLIAATIAAYTLVDNEGIEHASAIPYLELVLLPVALSALVFHASTGRLGALRGELGWPSLAAGVCSFAAYALALAALSLAPAAAVAAVRETGILFAVALGLVVLREPVGRERAVGAVLVVGGVALVALG